LNTPRAFLRVKPPVDHQLMLTFSVDGPTSTLSSPNEGI
jgi:hypothetical protein